MEEITRIFEDFLETDVVLTKEYPAQWITIQIIEISNDLYEKHHRTLDLNDIYFNTYYQYSCLLSEQKDIIHTMKIIEDLKNKKSLWDLYVFDDIKLSINKTVEEQVKAPVILSGGEICPKCNSNQIESTQIQANSGDEGSTNKYKCAVCGQQWTKKN